MGGCVSTPKSCVGAKLRSSKQRRKSRRRRKIQRKRAVSSRFSDGSFDNLDQPRNFSNPSSRGLHSSLLFPCFRFSCSDLILVLRFCMVDSFPYISKVLPFYCNCRLVHSLCNLVSESVGLDSDFRVLVIVF